MNNNIQPNDEANSLRIHPLDSNKLVQNSAAEESWDLKKFIFNGTFTKLAQWNRKIEWNHKIESIFDSISTKCDCESIYSTDSKIIEWIANRFFFDESTTLGIILSGTRRFALKTNLPFQLASKTTRIQIKHIENHNFWHVFAVSL